MVFTTEYTKQNTFAPIPQSVKNVLSCLGMSSSMTDICPLVVTQTLVLKFLLATVADKGSLHILLTQSY